MDVIRLIAYCSGDRSITSPDCELGKRFSEEAFALQEIIAKLLVWRVQVPSATRTSIVF